MCARKKPWRGRVVGYVEPKKEGPAEVAPCISLGSLRHTPPPLIAVPACLLGCFTAHRTGAGPAAQLQRHQRAQSGHGGEWAAVLLLCVYVFWGVSGNGQVKQSGRSKDAPVSCHACAKPVASGPHTYTYWPHCSRPTSMPPPPPPDPPPFRTTASTCSPCATLTSPTRCGGTRPSTSRSRAPVTWAETWRRHGPHPGCSPGSGPSGSSSTAASQQ